MGHIIQVRKVISEHKSIFAGSGLFLLILFVPVNGIGFQEKSLAFICTAMVVEDFFMQTIDMRMFLAAFILLISLSSNYLDFIYFFVWGLLLFRLLFLATTKISFNSTVLLDTSENLIQNEKMERIPFGYLPSLFLSWVLYQIFISNMNIPIFLQATHNGILLFSEMLQANMLVAGGLVGVMSLFWILLEYRLHRAVCAQKDINYGFGDGDVYVLAAMFAFFGFEEFMIVFFISLIVQVFCYLVFFLWDEVRSFYYGK